ncbi:MAG: hypothetical protein AAFX85_13695 [Pseudomonadota bacterium]
MARGAAGDLIMLALARRPTLAWLAAFLLCAAALGARGEEPAAADAASAANELAEEEAEFLAFLEYLGSWEESDEEWQTFHPDEGLSELRLPAPRTPVSTNGPESGEQDEWDDNGRS